MLKKEYLNQNIAAMFRGIINIGNSCYLNSALQILMHLPFLNFLQSTDLVLEGRAVTESETPWCLKTFGSQTKYKHVRFFEEILLRFRQQYLAGDGLCNPKEMLLFLGSQQSDFEVMRACDAQEALMYLLDLVGTSADADWDRDVEDFFFRGFSSESIQEWKKYSPRYSKITLYITSQLEENIFCKVCKQILHKRFPIFTMFDIDEGDISLLNEGVKRESLEGYECDTCRKTSCIKVTCWNYFGDYIIFYNKRKSFFLRSELKLPCVKKKTLVSYDLVMSINHRGGHFNCFVRKDSNWILCDDGNVVSGVPPPSNTIYLYVFKKKGV